MAGPLEAQQEAPSYLVPDRAYCRFRLGMRSDVGIFSRPFETIRTSSTRCYSAIGGEPEQLGTIDPSLSVLEY